MELNFLEVESAALDHEYEDLGKFSAATLPAGSESEYDVIKCGKATKPASKTTASDSNYDTVKCTDATGPVRIAAASEADYDTVKCIGATGPVRKMAASEADNDTVKCTDATGKTIVDKDYNFTECPAYRPVGFQSQP